MTGIPLTRFRSEDVRRLVVRSVLRADEERKGGQPELALIVGERMVRELARELLKLYAEEVWVREEAGAFIYELELIHIAPDARIVPPGKACRCKDSSS